MVVNVDSSDKTWNAHLGGLLEILSQPDVITTCAHPLIQVLSYLKQDVSLHDAVNMQSTGKQKLGVFYCMAKLQLRSIAMSIVSLFSVDHSPRKLDLERISVGTRDIHRNLELGHRMLKVWQRTTCCCSSSKEEKGKLLPRVCLSRYLLDY